MKEAPPNARVKEERVTLWSTERVQQRFREEIHLRFEAENAQQKKEEAEAASMEEPGDSYLWEIYKRCAIKIDRNHVRVRFPAGFSIDQEVLAMFDNTEVGWTCPSIVADGATLVLDLLLVDSWNNERSAQWLAQQLRSPQ
jgi:hypothetical protein